MNKKMLLVVLLPVVVNANVATDVLKDAKKATTDLFAFARAPFGKDNSLNCVANAANAQIAQQYAQSIADAVDAKLLGKTLVNTNGVTVTSADVLRYVAAVGTSVALDKLNPSNKNSDARNAVSHAATRLVVAALEKAYGKVSPQVTAVLGVDLLDFDSATNEVLPKDLAVVVNYVRNTLVAGAVYNITKNAVENSVSAFVRAPAASSSSSSI